MTFLSLFLTILLVILSHITMAYEEPFLPSEEPSLPYQEEQRCKPGKTGEIKECPPYESTDRAFTLYVETGIMHHEYMDPLFKNKLKDDIPFVGGGMSMKIGRFSIDGYTRQSDDGNYDYFSGDNYTDADFKHGDYVLTAVATFFQRQRVGLSVFLGHRWGDTNVIANRIDSPNQMQKQEVELKTQGPFIGVGLFWKPFGEESHTKLSVTGAYGHLTGDYSSSGLTGEGLERIGVRIDSTNGLKFGIAGGGALLGSGKLRYRVSLDYYDYKMDLDTIMPGDAFVQERLVSLNASLIYVFDVPIYYEKSDDKR